MDDKDPHIRSQNSAHRRGLLLGLTMAEIMVLILFALLLALGAALSAKNKVILDRDRRVAELVAYEQQITELFRKTPDATTIEDVIQRLERQQKQIADLQQEVDRLRPYEAGGKALDDIIHAIRRNADDKVSTQQIVERLRQAGQLARDNENLRGQVAQLARDKEGLQAQVTQLTKDNENSQGQVAQLSNQIKAAGKGNEFPSCWVTPDGKTESIFELLVAANGIRIKDHYLSDRVTDKIALPLSAVRYDQELPLPDFQGQLRGIYQWSVDHQCRFYVIIFSSTSSASIQLLNAVGAYFYPDSRIQFRPGGL